MLVSIVMATMMVVMMVMMMMIMMAMVVMTFLGRNIIYLTLHLAPHFQNYTPRSPRPGVIFHDFQDLLLIFEESY